MSASEQRLHNESVPQPLRVLIIFYSRFGAIRELAGHIEEGVARVADTTSDLLEIGDTPFPELQGGVSDAEAHTRRSALLERVGRANALVIGGPAYFGAPAAALRRFFEDLATASGATLDRTRPWHLYLFRDKPGAAFSSSATPHGGNEQALQALLTMMMHLGMLAVTPAPRGPILEQAASPHGAKAITGPRGQRGLTAEEIEAAHQLGQRIAEVGHWLRDGRRVGAEHEREVAVSAAHGYDPSA